jgi:hypothetical protein
MAAANVKHFLCVAQLRELVDKSTRYEAHATYIKTCRNDRFETLIRANQVFIACYLYGFHFAVRQGPRWVCLEVGRFYIVREANDVNRNVSRNVKAACRSNARRPDSGGHLIVQRSSQVVVEVPVRNETPRGSGAAADRGSHDDRISPDQGYFQIAVMLRGSPESGAARLARRLRD